MYCRVLKVSRQGFYQYISRRERPWKYQGLAEAMWEIYNEDVCNEYLRAQTDVLGVAVEAAGGRHHPQ